MSNVVTTTIDIIAAIIKFNKYFFVLQNNGTNIFPYSLLFDGQWIQNKLYVLLKLTYRWSHL